MDDYEFIPVAQSTVELAWRAFLSKELKFNPEWVDDFRLKEFHVDSGYYIIEGRGLIISPTHISTAAGCFSTNGIYHRSNEIRMIESHFPVQDFLRTYNWVVLLKMYTKEFLRTI